MCKINDAENFQIAEIQSKQGSCKPVPSPIRDAIPLPSTPTHTPQPSSLKESE